MRHLHRGWSLLVLLLALLAVVPAMAAPTHFQAMTGQIRKVDIAANTVTVASLPGMKEQQTTFHLPPDVSITRHDQKVAVGELKEGDRVTVQYARENGRLTVHSIASKASGAEPAKLGN